MALSNVTSLYLDAVDLDVGTGVTVLNKGDASIQLTSAGVDVVDTLPKFGSKSLRFAGSASSYLRVVDNHKFTWVGVDYTQELWFYPETGSPSAYYLYAGSIGHPYQVYVDTGGLRASSPYGTIFDSKVVPALDQWHWLVIQRRGSSYVMMLDGVVVSAWLNTSFDSRYWPSDNTFYLGGNPLAYPSNMFKGRIALYRFVRTAVYDIWAGSNAVEPFTLVGDAHASKVVTLLNFDGPEGNTTFTDEATTPLTYTASGNAKVTTLSQWKGNPALTLNRSNDAVTTPYSAATDLADADFCMEVVMSPRLDSNMTFYAWNARSDSYAQARIEWGPSFNRAIRLLMQTQGGGWIVNSSGDSVPFQMYDWASIALMRRKSRIYLTVNGTLAISVDIGTASLANDGVRKTVLGNWWPQNTGEAFQGLIASTRVTKGEARYGVVAEPTTIPDAVVMVDVTGTGLLHPPHFSYVVGNNVPVGAPAWTPPQPGVIENAMPYGLRAPTYQLTGESTSNPSYPIDGGQRMRDSSSPLNRDWPWELHGAGVIRGTVKEPGAGGGNVPVRRRVALYRSTDMLHVRTIWSNADGTYEFKYLNPAFKYTVMSFDYKGNYRAVVSDNLPVTEVEVIGPAEKG